MSQKPQFLYQFHPLRPELIENPDLWTKADIAMANAHVAHLQQGAKDGIVILAGRAQDNIGPAIVVLEVETEADAQAFMERDPFVVQKFARATLHPFRVAISRNPV